MQPHPGSSRWGCRVRVRVCVGGGVRQLLVFQNVNNELILSAKEHWRTLQNICFGTRGFIQGPQ